jgi:hypothetical protein
MKQKTEYQAQNMGKNSQTHKLPVSILAMDKKRKGITRASKNSPQK